MRHASQLRSTPGKPDNDHLGHGITFVLGLLTLLATIGTAIPSFVSLNESRADVYYSRTEASVLNPDTPDYQQLRQVLATNNIPETRLTISLINTGDGPAK